MKKIFDVLLKQLSKLGRAMLVPMTALPVSGLVTLIFGTSMLNVPFVANAGWVAINNMDLLFAVGAVMAYAKGKDKTNPFVAGVLSVLVLKSVLANLNEDISMGIFAGIIMGCVTAFVYNKTRTLKTPSIVDFFTGDKFVITLMPIYSVLMGMLLSVVWPPIQDGLNAFSLGLGSMGALGVFLFGFLNRLLIPVGLHHVVNSYIYYALGSWTSPAGDVVTGDLARFIAGDPAAGTYLTMFYVTMMFGLPSAAFAMYRASKKSKREETGGLMISTASTAFLTGITEPIEFSFMFVAPQLYFVHAFYTGLAGAICYLLNVRMGFVNNGDIIDMVLNWNRASNPVMLVVIGLVFAVLYYVTFYVLITKMDLKTPGRVEDMIESVEVTDEEKNFKLETSNFGYLAKKLVQSLGGAENIEQNGHCATRLRVEVYDGDKVEVERIKQMGVKGVVKTSPTSFQIIIGSDVGKVYDEVDKLL